MGLELSLYTYYASLGTTAVGTLSSMTNPTVVSVTRAAGSYNTTAMALLIYNNSGNPVLTNMKVAISTSSTTNDSYYGYTSFPVSYTITPSKPYFFPYQVSRQMKFTTTVYLLIAPSWTGNANVVAYDANCALPVMRIALKNKILCNLMCNHEYSYIR